MMIKKVAINWHTFIKKLGWIQQVAGKQTAGSSLFHSTWLEEPRLWGESCSGKSGGPAMWGHGHAPSSRMTPGRDSAGCQEAYRSHSFTENQTRRACDPAGATNTFFPFCLPDWDLFPSLWDSLTLTSHPDGNICPTLTLTWHQPIPLRLSLHPKMILCGKVKADHNVLTAKECPQSVGSKYALLRTIVAKRTRTLT